MLLTIKCFAASFGLIIGYLYGEQNICLQLLVFCVCADYLTGVLSAMSQKQLSSKIGFKGIAKKLVLFILVALAHALDRLLSQSNMLRDATICFYIGNELISLLENTCRMNIPIPKKLRQTISQLIAKQEEETTDE